MKGAAMKILEFIRLVVTVAIGAAIGVAAGQWIYYATQVYVTMRMFD